MPKFITLTVITYRDAAVKSSKKSILRDINFDLVKSFTKDEKGDFTQVVEDYTWNVEETPEQIRELLNTSTSVVNVVNQAARKPSVIVPMRYTFEGVEVSEQEIVDALRLSRNIKFKGLLGQDYINWVRSVFHSHSDPRPGSYDVGANQAIEIAEIIKSETLRRFREGGTI